jgi:hypothetical protein
MDLPEFGYDETCGGSFWMLFDIVLRILAGKMNRFGHTRVGAKPPKPTRMRSLFEGLGGMFREY